MRIKTKFGEYGKEHDFEFEGTIEELDNFIKKKDELKTALTKLIN